MDHINVDSTDPERMRKINEAMTANLRVLKLSEDLQIAFPDLADRIGELGLGEVERRLRAAFAD